MPRFAADVDSPPAKQPIPIVQDTPPSGSAKVKRKWWLKKPSSTEKKKRDTSSPVFTPVCEGNPLKVKVERTVVPRSEFTFPVKQEERIKMRIKKEKSPILGARDRTNYEPIRKFNVDKIPSRSSSSTVRSSRGSGKKSITRCSIEMTLLLAIALALGYYGVKDMSFTSKCDTALPDQLQRQLEIGLQARVFRQEIAVQNISLLLKAHKGLTTMSFLGGCGTGKSFVATEMTKHFTQRNSHSYLWGEGAAQDHLNNFGALQELIMNLPSCQPQLLIVDNLSWQQKPYVEDMFRWLKSTSRLQEKSLVIVYIFNLNKFAEERREGEEDQNLLVLEELEKTNIVVFRSFEERDVREYLGQVKGSMELEEELLEMIVDNANVKEFGLKRLANKFQTLE